MKISIKSVSAATADEWDFIWRNCDYATYFHSREWAEIWNIYTNGKICPHPKLVVFSDGSKALIPLSFEKIMNQVIINKVYLSSPGGTFGGWISQDELNIEHAFLLYHFIIENLSNLVWRVNPYDKNISSIKLTTTQEDETNVLNLGCGFEAIYKTWTKGHSSAVRKARKEGVSVKLATTLDEWNIYYQVYEESFKRWGNKASSKYEWTIFEEMFKRNSPNIKLWLAIYQDTIVAGALIFYAKQHTVYWHGAALSNYFYVRPVNLLIYEAIKNACESGYTWFDFNPSGKHEGVKAFKKSFGTESLACPVVRKYNYSLKVLKKVETLFNDLC